MEENYCTKKVDVENEVEIHIYNEQSYFFLICINTTKWMDVSYNFILDSYLDGNQHHNFYLLPIYTYIS